MTHAIVGRVLCWGLYKRAFDGLHIYESWFWGLYRRVKVMVPPLRPERAAPHNNGEQAREPKTLPLVTQTQTLGTRRLGPIPLTVRHSFEWYDGGLEDVSPFDDDEGP